MPVGDFSQKLGAVLKAINLSRGRLAHTVGVDKSVVSRWASGVQAPTDHNLTLLTEEIGRHVPGFARVDWELAAEAFAARLGLAEDSSAGEPALALPVRSSIAVLPFENMSGDPEQSYFADGLAEDLITGLSRVSWLFVIAQLVVRRRSSMHARSASGWACATSWKAACAAPASACG
jgi:transcriptional regulator with XRE-family HTH domain